MKCPRCQQENPPQAKFCLECATSLALRCAATQAIPVIAVTASVMAQERQKVMVAGFDGFQGKPISERELLETVRHILDR